MLEFSRPISSAKPQAISNVNSSSSDKENESNKEIDDKNNENGPNKNFRLTKNTSNNSPHIHIMF